MKIKELRSLQLSPHRCSNCNHRAPIHYICESCFSYYCESCEVSKGLLWAKGVCPRCHAPRRQLNQALMTELCFQCGEYAMDRQYKCQDLNCEMYFCQGCADRSFWLGRLICPRCGTDKVTVFRRRHGQIPGLKARRRGGFTDGLVQAVMRKSANHCVQCGAMNDLQIDHIIPHSLGGSDELANLQILCGSCNRAKGNLTG